MTQIQNQEIINQLEDIKERVMNLERALIEEEEPTTEEMASIKKGIKEYAEGKATLFKFSHRHSL